MEYNWSNAWRILGYNGTIMVESDSILQYNEKDLDSLDSFFTIKIPDFPSVP
jgi:hypothetical protein